MDPKHTSGGMLLAPGASTSAFPSSFPSRDRRAPSSFPPPEGAFPAVDDHLVLPEVSREEIIRGRKIVTMGANPPHAETHARADFLIMPHVRDDYIVSSHLLTRVNHGSNFATDVSIRRKGLDPQVALALWKKGNPTLMRILADGRKEGHEEGYKDGQREMLVRVLERRFGPLGIDATSRIQAADSDVLGIWADRIWDATCIDDVLE